MGIRKRFIVPDNFPKPVINEKADRHLIPVMELEFNNSEEEPVACYCAGKYKTKDDVSESIEDEEARLLDAIDEGIMNEEEAYEILPFAGEEPRLCVPGRVVKTVKRVLHPERKRPVAACFCALTGLLIFVY